MTLSEYNKLYQENYNLYNLEEQKKLDDIYKKLYIAKLSKKFNPKEIPKS